MIFEVEVEGRQLEVGLAFPVIVDSEAACPKRFRCKCRFLPHKPGFFSRWDHYEHDRIATITGPDDDVPTWFKAKLDKPVREGKEVGLFPDGYPRFEPDRGAYFDEITVAPEGTG
ncbi:MAG: hypothetical protein KGL39_11910 [Patescibacteria group bacterium]|nr:hypothetical protein [Patescibacteria group bacterium]